MDPRMPATITNATVRGGNPPISFEIAIATGDVTDFGSKENKIWWLMPNNMALYQTPDMARRVPDNTPPIIGSAFSY